MKFKKIVLILAVICLLLSLTACSENTKSEQDICDELKACFINEYSYLSFDDVTISVDQRQTNKGDKTDLVWASVYARNDDLQFTGNYNAMYVLYNDGWVLESYDLEDGQFNLLRSTVTEEQAETAVWNENLTNYPYLTLVNRKTELVYGKDSFYFEGSLSDGYMTTVETIEVQYSYNYGANKWNLDFVRCIATDEIWDVVGKWEYKSGNDSMQLYIHEIGNGIAKIEYDFDYIWEEDVIFYGPQKEDRHHTSNGVETREYGVSFSGDSLSFGLLGDDDKKNYIEIHKTEGVTFDDNLAESNDEYYLTYIGK